MKRRQFLAASGAAVIGGCTVGADYAAPTMDLPENFAGGSTKARAEKIEWWTELGDRDLNALVTRGLAQNLEIKIASRRVAEAQGNLSATGRQSQIGGTLDAASARAGGSGTKATTTNSATLGASFVFDIFGRVQRNQEQAGATLDASRFDNETARLSFLSGLVGSYIDARYFQEALAVARQSVASRRKTLSIVRSQENIGSASKLETTQAKAQLEQVQALLPPLEAQFNAAVFAIATLLAEPAAPILAQMTRGAAPTPTTCTRRCRHASGAFAVSP